MFEEFLLDRVERLPLRDALDGENILAVYFGREHETRRDEAPVEEHGAGAAVTGRATLLGAGEIEPITQGVQQCFDRFAEELDRFAVEYCLYM